MHHDQRAPLDRRPRLSFAHEFVLRGEAGVWDQQSRVDKLVLRFWYYTTPRVLV